MNEMEELVNHIKRNWFNHHEAQLKLLDRVIFLDWRRKETSEHAVRYLFDGSNLFISGDLGEAVFSFTQPITLHTVLRMGFGEFFDALSCSSNERWDYDPNKAMDDLEVWYESVLVEAERRTFGNTALYDTKEQFVKETEMIYKALFNIIECSGIDDKIKEREMWAFYCNDSHRFVRYSGNDFEKFTHFGRKMTKVMVAYRVGLSMASEYLYWTESE